MVEVIIIASILFGGGLALGVALRRFPKAALALTFSFGVVVGIGVGDWSGYSAALTRVDQFLYACATILPYFVIVLTPAICGAAVGVLLGRRRSKTHSGSRDNTILPSK